MGFTERAKAWEKHVGKNWKDWDKPFHITILRIFGGRVAKFIWMLEEAQLTSEGRMVYTPNHYREVGHYTSMLDDLSCPVCRQLTMKALSPPYVITNKGYEAAIEVGVDAVCTDSECFGHGVPNWNVLIRESEIPAGKDFSHEDWRERCDEFKRRI